MAGVSVWIRGVSAVLQWYYLLDSVYNELTGLLLYREQ